MLNTARIKYVGYVNFADDVVSGWAGTCNPILARDEFELHRDILSTNIEEIFVYDVINKRELTDKDISEIIHKNTFSSEECKYSSEIYCMFNANNKEN